MDDVTQADLILVTDLHADEVGHAVEIAQKTGARLVASGWDAGGWFIDMGVPREQVDRTSAGGRVRLDGVTVRLVSGIHGSGAATPTADWPYGGPAAAYFVTFENGWTVFYGGSSSATQDWAMWAPIYRPDAAILNLGSSKEPLDFAMSVKLLMTDNPNLSAIFPGHHLFVQRPGQTTIAEAQVAMDAMGLGLSITEPVPGQVFTYTK